MINIPNIGGKKAPILQKMESVERQIDDFRKNQENRKQMEEGLLDMYFEFSPKQQGMDAEELQAALKSFGFSYSLSKVESLMDEYDEDEAGVIDFEEFRELMITVLQESSQKAK